MSIFNREKTIAKISVYLGIYFDIFNFGIVSAGTQCQNL